MDVEGYAFQPPPGFRTEDHTVALAPPGNGGARPSLIIQSKPARPGTTLTDFAAEALVELGKAVPGISGMSRGELAFADGGAGALLAYNFDGKSGKLRQYVALRLEKGRLCTITVTVPADKPDPATAQAVLKSIASVKPT